MKRGIIAAVILISVTALAITVNHTLSQKAERLYVLAQSAVYDKAALEEFGAEWDREIIYFELFTDHSYFETIDKKIKKLRYVEGDNYRTACAEAMIDISALKEHISFSFPSIF